MYQYMGTSREVAPEQLKSLFILIRKVLNWTLRELTQWETNEKQVEGTGKFCKGFVYVISHPGMSGSEFPREDFQEALFKHKKKFR